MIFKNPTARIALALALAVLIGLGAGADAACPKAPQPPLRTAPLTVETLRGAFDFTVELATTEAERSCGLMRRPRLKPEEGMMFRQDPPGPAYFWMKDTPQPLDILFLDAEGRVLHFVTHTTPYSTGIYGAQLPIAAVLELRAGSSARMALEIGDRVRHAWFATD